MQAGFKFYRITNSGGEYLIYLYKDGKQLCRLFLCFNNTPRNHGQVLLFINPGFAQYRDPGKTWVAARSFSGIFGGKYSKIYPLKTQRATRVALQVFFMGQVQVISRFYPGFTVVLLWFTWILCWFYPGFIQVLVWFYMYFMLVLPMYFQDKTLVLQK